jgi:hypothetical protein
VTSQVQRRSRGARSAQKVGARALPWVILGLVTAVLLLLAFRGPDAVLALFRPKPPAASGPLTLRLIHTNDTWGYLSPCG